MNSKSTVRLYILPMDNLILALKLMVLLIQCLDIKIHPKTRLLLEWKLANLDALSTNRLVLFTKQLFLAKATSLGSVTGLNC